jgi:NAD(P)H-hydrate epimerase
LKTKHILVSAETAQALDREASSSWGLHPFALVEAAGRNCACVFAAAHPALFERGAPRIVALAGSGNNGADALVMLRALLLQGLAGVSPSATHPLSLVAINHFPQDGENNPRSEAFRALAKMGVATCTWDNARHDTAELLEQADIIIDGIAGTGLQGALHDPAAQLVETLNTIRQGEGKKPFIVSIDVPSGDFDQWEAGMPILRADATLAIKPLKLALYKPLARPYAGTILKVGEVFPPKLVEQYEGAEFLDWETVKGRIPAIKPDTYKHERGVAEIHAGSPGSGGAAHIAARGALAAGAGLTRLIVDDALYPILAANAGGVMVVPASGACVASVAEEQAARFQSDAMLLGPGWGKSADRVHMLDKALSREATGVPLVLDADAIALAKDRVFHGNAILTPHAGEFAAFAELPKEAALLKEAMLANPWDILAKTAREKRATILFKGHVLIVAAPDGRVGVVDGMAPVLAAGGSGDLLAGICVALAARMKRSGAFDGYTCAVTAAALLIATARLRHSRAFVDPLDLAGDVAELAGSAWLWHDMP